MLIIPILTHAFGEDKSEMTQDKFLSYLANGFLDNTDHCPDSDDLTYEQQTKLQKFGELIMTDDNGFMKELQAKLRLKNSKITVKKIDECPTEIAARGPQRCYTIKSDTQKLVDFSVGPYTAAGIDCTKIKAEAHSLKNQSPKKTSLSSENR